MNDSPFANLDTSLLRSTKPPIEKRDEPISSPIQKDSPRTSERPLTRSHERANAPTSAESFARIPVRPNGKRIITRNSFEIYEDQMDALRRLAFEDKMAGAGGSQSAMVREAIDTIWRNGRENKTISPLVYRYSRRYPSA